MNVLNMKRGKACRKPFDMGMPAKATDLVRLAIKAGDPYCAAAVHNIATGRDKRRLEALMFDKRRNTLLLARWEHTPASVLEAIANSSAGNGDSGVVIRLDKNPNATAKALSQLYVGQADVRQLNSDFTVLIAQHLHSPVSVLASIVQLSEDEQSLKAVSRNPAASAEVLSVMLERMANSKIIGVLYKNLAENPSTSTELLDFIYAKGDEYVRAAVIGHARCSQAVIDESVSDKDVKIMRKLAVNARVSSETLVNLAASHDVAVRCGVASNVASPEVLVMRLLLDDSCLVRRAIAARLDLTAASINALANDKDSWVRQWLARNPRIPRKVLERLSVDFEVDVRRAVARNTCCPVGLLKALAKDQSAWVRSAVAYQHKSPKVVMEALATDNNIDVLSGVANNPHTPQMILQDLAASPELDIRRGVILNKYATRKTLLPLLEDPYYLHRLMLVGSVRLKGKDKWSLRDDPDFQVRFMVFRWMASRLCESAVR